MGERQAKAHMNGNGVSAEGRALPLRFDAAARVVYSAWLDVDGQPRTFYMNFSPLPPSGIGMA